MQFRQQSAGICFNHGSPKDGAVILSWPSLRLGISGDSGAGAISRNIITCGVMTKTAYCARRFWIFKSMITAHCLRPLEVYRYDIYWLLSLVEEQYIALKFAGIHIIYPRGRKPEEDVYSYSTRVSPWIWILSISGRYEAARAC